MGISRRGLVSRAGFAIASLLLLALPLRAHAQQVFQIDGVANQVGKELPPPGSHGGAQVNVSGKLAFDGVIDLCAATLTIDALLGEAAGDLLTRPDGSALLPVVLGNPRCISSDHAIFASPSEDRPWFRAEIRRRSGNVYDWKVKVKRGNIPVAPSDCASGPAAALGTSFTLDDGTNPPLAVATIEDWRCLEKSLRVASKSPAPTSVPVPTPTPSPSPTPGPPTPTPTRFDVVPLDFTAAATRLDEAGAPSQSAQVRVSTRFCSPANVDLTSVSASITSLLFEDGGAGELVEGLPAILSIDSGTASEAKFSCDAPSPSCNLRIKQSEGCTLPSGDPGFRFDLELRVDQSQGGRRPITYSAPPTCADGGTTTLETSLSISNGVALDYATSRVWRCSGSPTEVRELRTP